MGLFHLAWLQVLLLAAPISQLASCGIQGASGEQMSSAANKNLLRGAKEEASCGNVAALEASTFPGTDFYVGQIRKLLQQNTTTTETTEEEELKDDGRGVFWNDWKHWTWTQKTYFIVSWTFFGLFMLFICYNVCFRRQAFCMRWNGQPAPTGNAAA